jgi:hypothetical protein
MSYLNWISDDDLRFCIQEVLDAVAKANENADENIESNVIDPFSALFDMMRQNLSYVEWLNQEKSRQVQKTMQNEIGFFHQNVLGFTNGSENPGRHSGADFVNRDKRIIAEIKNKYNTMNSSSAAETYRKLDEFLGKDFSGFVAYVVFIVPQKSEDYDVAWSPAKEKLPLRDDIRKIDGESFYRIVTGDPDALEDLFVVLPEIISTMLPNRLDQDSKKAILEIFTKVYK